MLTVHRVVLYGIFLFFWPAERWVNFYSIFFWGGGGGGMSEAVGNFLDFAPIRSSP